MGIRYRSECHPFPPVLYLEGSDGKFCTVCNERSHDSSGRMGELSNRWHKWHGFEGVGDSDTAAMADAKTKALDWMESVKDEMQQVLALLPGHIAKMQAEIDSLKGE